MSICEITKTCHCAQPVNNICKFKGISSFLLNAMESSLYVFVFVVDIYLKRDTVVNVVVVNANVGPVCMGQPADGKAILQLISSGTRGVNRELYLCT